VAISVESPLRGDEVEAYVREAHRIIAGKLSKTVRAELGL
jgi:predicted DNA-binding protein (MmcQ/YjbR family)